MALPGPIPSPAAFATESKAEIKDEEPRLHTVHAEPDAGRGKEPNRRVAPERGHSVNRSRAASPSAYAPRDHAEAAERSDDSLRLTRTHLPDREALQLRLQQCTDEAFLRHRLLAMIFVEVVGFPVLAASTPAAGHAMLTAVATRHSFCTHASAEPGPCCIHGLVMAQPGTGDSVLARSIATRARAQLDGRYWLDDRAMEISVSIGLVLQVEPAVAAQQRQRWSATRSEVR